MVEKIKSVSELKMQKSLSVFKSELSKIRTGRAHTSLLDQVRVSYYGNETPLSQVANVAVEDARTLTVTPWEKGMISEVEKAIMSSGLGLNPMSAGMVIRVPLPALTEERRRDLTKLVRDEAEKARVAIRNIRREAISEFKALLKEKEISEDDERRAEEGIQQLTNKYVGQIDEVCSVKEKDLLAI